MALRQRQRPTLEDRLASPVTHWAYRLAGSVLCAFGVLIAVGLINVLWDAFTDTAVKPLDPVLPLVLAPIGAFCLEIGSRLVLGRRNRHGSLMSPRSWRVLGVVFAVVTVWLAWSVTLAGRFADLDVGLMGALLTSFCFGFASYLDRRSRPPAP